MVRAAKWILKIARWASPSVKNAQYVVQPYYVPANVFRFVAPPGFLTFSFQWEPGQVSFKTERWRRSQPSFRHRFRTHFYIRCSAIRQENVRMNYYVFQNEQSPLQRESEVGH